ncbi:hypothetical protein Bca101_045687 [Brassica carinata]
MENLISVIIFTLLFPTIICDPSDRVFEEVSVGLVVDLGSVEGKIIKTSFTLALADFYRKNSGYRTRVSVLDRDSRGHPLVAFAAATNLLRKAKVEVIVGAQSLPEAKLLAAISKKAKRVVISTLVPNSLSLNKYDHFIQLTHDRTTEAKGIASLIHEFSWKSVVVLYEDVYEWTEGLQVLTESFEDKEIHIARFDSFSLPLGEKHIMNQLREVKDSGSTVFVVHMSEMLFSRLFQYSEKIGMMEEGYAWILTTRSMTHFEGGAIRAMQGVIGFRSYTPISKEVENFTSRVKQLMSDDDDDDDDDTYIKRFSSIGVSVRAHDIACILATVVEKISRVRGRATRNGGLNLTKHDDNSASSYASDLLKTITHSRWFKGLSGDIQINENRFLSETFELVNIVGFKERRIGEWSSGSFSKRRRITWPGGSGKNKITRNRVLAEKSEKKLLRVLVSASNRVPNLVSARHDPETGFLTVSGFCVEVFRTCVAPFKYDLEFIPYNGSYDNLAYLLSTQKHKYDAAVGDITITSNRSLYVDFSMPFTDIGIGALTLVKKKKQGMWTFFDPLETSLWLASGTFFILTGVVVWLVERPVNSEFQGSWRRQLDPHAGFGPPIIKNVKHKSIYAVEAYAQALRDGTLSYVVEEIPYLNILLVQNPDIFAMVARDATTNGFGFMFQKGSALVPKVSREIVKLRSMGTLKDIEKRWFQKLDSVSSHSDADVDDDVSSRFTIHELGGLFIIAGVAHALVLTMHLFQMRQEILHALWESGLVAKLQSFTSFSR